MEKKPKWVEIYDALQKRLRDGEFPQGVALPSEESIVRRYKVSRITAVKAMDELRRNGLVYRRRGSGTFATKFARREAGQLGMIFPSLAVGEIFPRICQTLVRLAQKDGYSFVLGDISSPDPARRAHEACDVARMFVKQKIAGVVLQPLAFLKTPERVTKEIMHMLDDADIPLVLVDRDLPDGETARYDFVGIDNVAAGRTLGAHLAGRGAKRIAVPGCHASGFIALVYPLIEAGLISPDARLVCHSLTGYSGGGKKMIAQYEGERTDALLGAPRQYGAAQNHKHLAEMIHMTGLRSKPVFCPIVADFYSGMEVTVPLFAQDIHGSVEAVRDAYAEKYTGPVVRFSENTDESGFYSAAALSDMDGMEIIRSVREWTQTPIVVVSARMHERDKVEALDAGAEELRAQRAATFRRAIWT